ncbi:MAG: hypothetical protein IIA67_00965 [Planctomycetes bacterium]|nr:hypothetical protein [Planctomycetota bacterium]
MDRGRRSATWWVLRGLALLAAVVLVFVVLYVWPDSRIVVGPETTYLTEPLDEDGRVDYLAAINQRAAEGVTPENNAAVLYWQALGPGPIDEEHREEFFRRLGMKPLPVDGDYFQSLYELQERLDDQEKYARRNRSRDKREAMEARHLRRERRRDAMGYTPWVLDDDPELACWLAENQGPIDLFATGTRRAQHFIPMLVRPNEWEVEPSYSVMASRSYAQDYREMARTLIQRSMLHSGNGRHKEAWEDCLACFRLARHTARESIAVEILINFALVSVAAAGVPTILHEGDFTADELAKMRQAFRDVATCASAAEALNWGERLMALDTIRDFSREPRGLRGGIEWNHVLREANRSYDAMVAATNREMSGEANASDTEALEEEQQEALDAEDPWLLAAYPFSRQARTRHMTKEVVGLLIPAFSSMTADERRCKGRLRRLEMVFAVSLYRAENGQYPANLSALVPAYLDEVPLDPTNDLRMNYRKQGEGYLVWSVGRNGVDDKGRNGYDARDAGVDEPWDDEVDLVPRRLKSK